MLTFQRYSVLIPTFCALVPVLGLGLLCATLNCPLSLSHTLYCMSLPTSAQTWHTCYLIFPQPCSCMTSVRCRSVCRVNDNEYCCGWGRKLPCNVIFVKSSRNEHRSTAASSLHCAVNTHAHSTNTACI